MQDYDSLTLEEQIKLIESKKEVKIIVYTSYKWNIFSNPFL